MLAGERRQTILVSLGDHCPTQPIPIRITKSIGKRTGMLILRSTPVEHIAPIIREVPVDPRSSGSFNRAKRGTVKSRIRNAIVKLDDSQRRGIDSKQE